MTLNCQKEASVDVFIQQLSSLSPNSLTEARVKTAVQIVSGVYTLTKFYVVHCLGFLSQKMMHITLYH